MDCPVCKSSGISEDARNCPQCNSDLEGLNLLKRIEKSNKNRFNFGIVMFVLLVVTIAVWLITLTLARNSDRDIDNIAEVEKFSDLKSELERSKNEILKLKSEKKELSNQLSEVITEKENRVETYIVKEGETLFTIARRVYGNGYKYVDLAKDNNIDAANSIVAGQELKIHY